MKIIKLFDLALKTFRANDVEVVCVRGRANKTIINLSKNLTYMPNIRAIREPIFLIPNAEKTFNHL